MVTAPFFLALLKQQGVGLKGISKSATPVNEDIPPLLEAGGKLEVCCHFIFNAFLYVLINSILIFLLCLCIRFGM